MTRRALNAGTMIAMLIVIAMTAAACASPSAQKPGSAGSGVASSSPSAASTASASQATSPAAGKAAGSAAGAAKKSVPPKPTVSALTRERIAYARKLGGKSHRGESLYFIVGTSEDSEAAAVRKLKKSIPSFGDVQMYYIVARSDDFVGMRPGWWVVIEARRKKPSADDLKFASRGELKGAYVKRATVRTSDPIPVYEDIVEGAD